MSNPEQRINPELALKAAQMANDQMAWVIQDNGAVSSASGLFHFHWDDHGDAFALERALKKEGWEFYFHSGTGFVASKAKNKPATNIGDVDFHFDESDTLLLLKAVSAQFSIPLYLEGGVGGW